MRRFAILFAKTVEKASWGAERPTQAKRSNLLHSNEIASSSACGGLLAMTGRAGDKELLEVIENSYVFSRWKVSGDETM